MTDPLVDALVTAVTTTPGATAPELRARIVHGARGDERTADFVDTVRTASWRITPERVRALVGAGVTEEAVYELTIAAATGAALRRFRAGMSALEAAGR